MKYLTKKKALLTFDYEVFLGKETGTIEKCVIDPTNRILDVLVKHDARAIFFVDAAWLLFLKLNIPPDLLRVSRQLKDIINAGSTIELHLHPQWLDAELTGCGISFKSTSSYKLHTLKKDEIQKLFSDSTTLLKEITGLPVKCFRAGGFCIEPFSELKEAFEQNRIRYDFSVVPGMLLRGRKDYSYDYTTIIGVSGYRFEDTVTKKDPHGKFTEIPVSTYLHNPVYTIIKILIQNSEDRKISGDGLGIYEEHDPFRTELRRLLRLVRTVLSVDNTQPGFFKYVVRSHFLFNPVLVLIGHPKTLSNQSIKNLTYISKNFNTLNSLELEQICK